MVNSSMGAFSGTQSLFQAPRLASEQGNFFQNINGQKVHYMASGPVDAPPMVLVHEFGGNLRHFNENIAALSKKFRVFSVDLLGYGLSDNTSNLSVETWSAQLQDFIRQVVMPRAPCEPVVVGNSLGGAVTLAAASTAPELIRGIALVNMPSSTGVAPGAVQTFKSVADPMAEWMMDIQNSVSSLHRLTQPAEPAMTGRRQLLTKAMAGVIAGAAALNAKPALADEDFANSRMSYSRFIEYLREGMVKQADFYENGNIAVVELIAGGRVMRTRVQVPGVTKELLNLMDEKGVSYTAHSINEDTGKVAAAALGELFVPLLLLGGGLYFLSRGAGLNGPNGPGAIGQSKAKFQMVPETGVVFDDVAGVDEAKQDLEEVVEFLKTPERFTAVGAKVPKGVLLVGPPGTGKTLLAKAIAGEAGVPFFSISGSEFVEMFVGVGASRVRDLFKKAKENAPCLIFVDEIDAVGRSRGTGIGGGNDEREQTLNQLLTEMDGFEGNTGVIVIAATNRADILDPALLRPGRFDRRVTVDVPDIGGRKQILKVHTKNKRLDENVSLDTIAMRTPGFSGADLANLMNEAAILSGRRNKESITNSEVDNAIDRIVAGMEGTAMTDGKAKKLVAYHEVGHAICGTLTPGHDPVQKVTLIPRGQARGLTWFIPGEDPSLITKSQIQARIVGALGGRAAEEVVFGKKETTTGASSDLQQVTNMAKQMVVNFGFSDIGPWALLDESAQSGDMIMRLMARNTMSEKMASSIDRNVKQISDDAYAIAIDQISSNRDAMDAIVDRLMEIETMTGDEFREMLSRYTTIPQVNLDAVERQKQGILAGMTRKQEEVIDVPVTAFKPIDQ